MRETLERKFNSPVSPLEKEIAGFGTWFHNLHLPDGTQTAPDHPLGDFPKFKWEQIASHIPDNLSGLSVLDVGCNAGFYTFELAKRGAEVTGIDVDEHYLKQARWAARQFNLSNKVSFINMQVYEIAKLDVTFDIILFMGVFYHLRYPTLALDILAQKFSQQMIFQTLTMPGNDVFYPEEDIKIDQRDLMMNPGWPKIAFIENSLEGDDTNWWAPNHAAVEALLRSAGLIVTNRPAHEIYICRRNKNFKFNSGELDTIIKYKRKSND